MKRDMEKIVFEWHSEVVDVINALNEYLDLCKMNRDAMSRDANMKRFVDEFENDNVVRLRNLLLDLDMSW